MHPQCVHVMCVPLFGSSVDVCSFCLVDSFTLILIQPAYILIYVSIRIGQAKSKFGQWKL